MQSRRVIVVGGGAAGVFAATACAEAAPGAVVTLLEKSPNFLAKVRISGGGRCNVTHACFDAREFATRYPRGEKELIGPLQRFSARDTVAWFEARGVRLKIEEDGRMFPTTDSSRTIIECLLHAAKSAGVRLRANCSVAGVRRLPAGFEVTISESIAAQRANPNPHPSPADEITRPQPLPKKEQSIPRATAVSLLEAAKGGFRGTGEISTGEKLICDRLLLTTGGCRAAAAGHLSVSIGHTLVPPVPSLFTFHLEARWLRELAGVSIESAEVSVPDTDLRERGPVLLTHWGLSGPAILRLSAWGARKLHALDYRFPLRINWLPDFTVENLARKFQARRESQGAKLLINAPLAPLTARLWEALVIASGIGRETRWATLTRGQQQQLARQLTRSELAVAGKSLNQDEFVTCGGVRLAEVNFQTMESRLCPGLYFAGELLDLDGLTGGFNFQAAWTTGWLAGRAIAAS